VGVLAELTWDSVPATATLLVPVGSCEQHGPHLPIGTDTLIATALADAAGARLADAVVAPALTITASGEHRGFPGTLSIGTEAMVTVLVELARSADWARRIVLVNGHGGNVTAVRRAVDTCRAEGREVVAWWPDLRELTDSDDLHAGRAETSIVLALRPELVRLDAAAPGPSPAIAELVEHGVRALSPTGVLGDPTGASPDDGRRLLAALVDQLVEAATR
jgi:mycofactocin precursor peptide peptidase